MELLLIMSQGGSERADPENQSQKEVGRASLAYFKRKAAEKATRQRRNYILELNQGRMTFNIPMLESKTNIRASLQRANKNATSRFYQLHLGHAMIVPFLKDRSKWMDFNTC